MECVGSVALTTDDRIDDRLATQRTVPFGYQWDGKEFIVKKWLLAAGLGLAMVTSAQAADKIAIVNMGNLFQQVAQKTGVSATLENEFKGRAGELQGMENDLQSKMQRLQRDGSTMKASDRSKLERRNGTASDFLSESTGFRAGSSASF